MPLITDDFPHEDGILKATSSANAPTPVKTVKVVGPAYQPTLVDTRETGYQNLASYVEGSPWNVDYYSQVITSDTQVGGPQSTQDPIYQPKHLIEGFELRVTSPLTASQDSDDNEMHYRGSANVFPSIIPNVGDVFLAYTGDGRRTLFRLTVSSKMSVMARSGYQIEYEAVTDSSEVLSALTQSVVKTSVFNRDFMRFGQNPIVVKERYNELLKAEDVIRSVLKQYFRKFFSEEYQTLILPHQGTIVYDPFLVKFLLATWSTHDAHEIRSVRKLGVDDDPNFKSVSLWDAVYERDASWLNEAFQQCGLMGTHQLYNHPGNDGIRFSGVNFLVTPIDPSKSPDAVHAYPRAIMGPTLVPSPENVVGSFASDVHGTDVKPITPTPLASIAPVTVDTYYVLSESFYKNDDAKTVLESLVWQYLRREALDLTQILQLTRQYNRWGVLEQFYYVPLALHLLRAARYTA